MTAAGEGALRRRTRAAALAVLLVASSCAATRRLPSLAEQGRRLHEMPAPHPESTDDTAAELNRLWESAPLPAHAFNFGFATAHAVKDVLILHESLRYRPDDIVYGVHPADFSRFVASGAATRGCRTRRDASTYP